MPLASRVDPFGNLFASPARGLLMGNRGGRIHEDERRLGRRRWASRAWICCRLDFKGRRRRVWGDSYTELFFLDEVTALAAGHRPCFECRRRDAEAFARAIAPAVAGGWPEGPQRENGHPGGEAAEGMPSDGLRTGRMRAGEMRAGNRRPRAGDIDRLLHAQRRAVAGPLPSLDRPLNDLPDGVMVESCGTTHAVRGGCLLRWTPFGYEAAETLPEIASSETPRSVGAGAGPEAARPLVLITPPAIVAALARGYRPLWHPSADQAAGPSPSR